MQIVSSSKEKENPLLDLLPLFLAQEPRSPKHDRNTPSTSGTTGNFVPSTPSEHTSQPNSPDDRPLPFGWERQIAATGRTYYINHHRRITTWQHPSDSDGSTVQFDPDLPPGWERRKTSTGRVLYLDHNAGITTWVDPTTDPEKGSLLAPLHRKLTYLASHLRLDDGVGDDFWIGQDTLFEDSVEALLSASERGLMQGFGIRMLDDTAMPFQEWIDILFCELFSPERGLFKAAEDNPSQVEININYLGRNSLRLYFFAGRLHALAMLHQAVFNLSFLPALYSSLENYNSRERTHRPVTTYNDDDSNPQFDDSVFLIERGKSMRMEAFIDGFVELVPPHVLRVFTLSELHVVLAAGRHWPTIEEAYLQLPAYLRQSQSEGSAFPSHTSEQLLDELMVKLTGFKIETTCYIEELT